MYDLNCGGPGQGNSTIGMHDESCVMTSLHPESHMITFSYSAAHEFTLVLIGQAGWTYASIDPIRILD